MTRTDCDNLENVLKAVDEKKLITDNTPSIDIFDLDYFRERIDSVKAAFPEDFILHAMALKANSIRGVLLAAKEKGLGAECASICETVHALSLGFPPEKVVFDSPCKTRVDLKVALDSKVYINLDNDYEMELVDELLRTDCAGAQPKIGLRINPVVGGGKLASMSTATKESKFGLPVMEETKDRIMDLYEKYQWLNGIHIHIGSQGVAMEKFVQGSRRLMDFVAELEARIGRTLETIDIGGGLSTTYKDDKEPEGFEYAKYKQELQDLVPELFTGKYRIITEFGRSLALKAGKTLSRIDYIKQWVPEVKPIILNHVGSNQFVRECYVPAQWSHRFSVATKEGKVKEGGEKVIYDLGGPMCFQGDYLAKDVELPRAYPGDKLIIHDTGAYTMSFYSHYNSILPSPIYGYTTKENGEIKFICFKERETYEGNMEFWGLAHPRLI